ncbi:hypothetical protein BKA70DRAFT_1558893 [Coprinopsis sp. MPI-PUGE-AT-0042]|nr:hypothetical protein BKA70DRAFT_1558893 [Coprinopsis sp. MPI-PUGE-AT-0042]
MKFTTLATLVAPALLWVSSVAAARGFAESCSGFRYTSFGNTFWANCDNETVVTGIDVDFCIGIDAYSNLECARNGEFITKGGCSNACELTGTELRCECPGGPRTIDLNTCIGLTYEQTLTC